MRAATPDRLPCSPRTIVRRAAIWFALAFVEAHMRTFRLAAALAALTFALAACGGGSSSSSSTPPPVSGGGSSSGGAGNGTPVDVTLADFSIDVAGGTKLKPGTYTFNVTNDGPTGHNLTIEGPG